MSTSFYLCSKSKTIPLKRWTRLKHRRSAMIAITASQSRCKNAMKLMTLGISAENTPFKRSGYGLAALL